METLLQVSRASAPGDITRAQAHEDVDGKQMVSSGAAVTNVAPANVSLMKVFPSSNLDDVLATAVENVPTDANWDFIVAHAICVF